jgi:hypothetical protein
MILSGGETGYHLLIDVKIVHARTTVHPHRFHEIRDEWREIVKNSSLSSKLLQELD